MGAGAAADSRFEPVPNAMDVIDAYARDVWTRRNPFPHGWVARLEGEKVGFILGLPLHAVPVLSGPRTAIITDIWVEPNYRRMGIGRRLVDAFRRASREAGYPATEVKTLVMDERAVAFWREQGFEDYMLSLKLEAQT